jgi:hypothetical protein
MSSAEPGVTNGAGRTELKTEEKTPSMERVRRGASEELKKPSTGAAIAGALVIGAAVVVGVPETILGATAGLIVYRILRKDTGTRGQASSP